MLINQREQYELADAIARAIRCNARIYPLAPFDREEASQHEVSALVRDAIDLYCDADDEDAYAAADERLTAQYEEGE